MPKNNVRHYFLNLSLGLLACFILVFSFIHESQEKVNQSLGITNASQPINIEQKNTQKVPIHSNYQLPPPGILPTNPLYILKMIRDRVGLILTTDPDQRALLLLHYADKRLATAWALKNLGFQTQAIETANKAETYLFIAIYESPKITLNKRAAWFDNLKRAVLKHEEVLEEMNLDDSSQGKDQINRMSQNLEQYRLQIVSFSGEPFGYPRPEDDLPTNFEATPSAIPANQPYL